MDVNVNDPPEIYNTHGPFDHKEAELRRWSQSHPRGCTVCCDLDFESWKYGIPIRLERLQKSREGCTFCDIFFQAFQTPYFSNTTAGPTEAYMNAFSLRIKGDTIPRPLSVKSFWDGDTSSIDHDFTIFVFPSAGECIITLYNHTQAKLPSSRRMAIRHK